MNWLISPFSEFEFMRYALASVLFLSVSAAPVGVFLVMRRMSLMGYALSHAVLPGAAVGYMLAGLSLPAIAFGGFITGLIMAAGAGLATRFSLIKEDANFAAFYLSCLALGVILVSKNGSNIEQDVAIKDFKRAIIFRIFNFLFDKISQKACLMPKVIGSDGIFENFGTIRNIKNAHVTPIAARTGILSSPRNCAVADDTKGPKENPNAPDAIKIPIFFSIFEVENFGTSPSDCG